MILSDYYTSSKVGEVFCVLFFYAVYPIISVNFNTYILLVLNQFMAISSPLRYSTLRFSARRKRNILLSIGGTWCVALGYLGIYLVLVHTGIGEPHFYTSIS